MGGVFQGGTVATKTQTTEAMKEFTSADNDKSAGVPG